MTDQMQYHMFIAGAQVTADGDYLPHTFTVFPADTMPEEAVEGVIRKILPDVLELEMDEAFGQINIKQVCSWEDWAEIDVPDDVKLRALVSSVTVSFFELMHSASITPKLANVRWGTEVELTES